MSKRDLVWFSCGHGRQINCRKKRERSFAFACHKSDFTATRVSQYCNRSYHNMSEPQPPSYLGKLVSKSASLWTTTLELFRRALFWEQLTFVTNADKIRSQGNFEPWPAKPTTKHIPPSIGICLETRVFTLSCLDISILCKCTGKDFRAHLHRHF